MKVYRCLSLILFISISSISYSQTTFPPYEEVIEKFTSQHSKRPNQDPGEIRFLKKPEGYYIEEFDISTGEFYRPQLFWDRQSNTYQTVDFPTSPASNSLKYTLLNKTSSELFDIHPFYGYEGWEKDVITEFENDKSSSVDIIYALGRAYSSLAKLKFSPSAFSRGNEFNVRNDQKNQLSANQVKEYRALRAHARKHYKKACELDPNFETIVGSICNKYYNEFISEYLELSLYQNEEIAKELIPAELYDEQVIHDSKARLSSCSENSILFTFGDMDTLPLLFLQLAQGFRTDISIVNVNLLQVNAYAFDQELRWDEKYSERLNTLYPRTYLGPQLDIIIIRDGFGIPQLDFNKYIELVNAGNDRIKEGPYFLIPSKTLILSSMDSKRFVYNIRRNTIEQKDLLLLDIIQTQLSKRTLHFTFPEVRGFSDSYFQKSGTVWKFGGGRP